MDTIITAADDATSGDHLIAPLEIELRRRHAPQAHYHLLRDGRLAARCSIWTDATPIHQGKHLGVIGHYAAVDLTAGQAILDHAGDRLRQRGFTLAVGPMDGNTWRRYRLLTQRGNQPPFFLEPDNPDDWPAHFTAAGFAPLSQYFSALNEDLTVTDPRAQENLPRLIAKGLNFRHFDRSRLEQELLAVHALSLESFADNFLYTPIEQAEFLAMYAPLRAHLQDELILLAEHDDQLIGFIFGLPDLLQVQRGVPCDTVIAKSMAVKPSFAGMGLGGVLMHLFQQAAGNLGIAKVIHALMHQDNRSLKISSRFGKPIRQYTLYSKELRP